MTTNVLIVGASRGLGLALAEEFNQRPDIHTIAGIRGYPPSSINIETLRIDITNPESVSSAASQITKLDILVINAGMGEGEKITKISTERLEEYLVTNTLGTHRVLREFLPALKRGKLKKIIIMSSQSGSMDRQLTLRMGLGGPYGVSKAACNMIAVQAHNDLNFGGSEEGEFIVVPLHPGWVATDMGKKVGDGGMSPKVAGKKLVDLILRLGKEHSGKFIGPDGEVLPW